MDVRGQLIVIGDDPRITQMLSSSLWLAGFEVEIAESGHEAVDSGGRNRPDLLVVDVGLSDMDGFEVVRHLRRRDVGCPAVFLVDSDVQWGGPAGGLTVGGDDYLLKPFSLDEVVTRVETVLRRVGTRQAGVRDTGVLRFADLELDEDSREVRRAGRSVRLAPMEHRLLRYLMRYAGMVVSRVQILEHVWPCVDAPRKDRALDVHISALRRKLDRIGPPLIHTRYGVGYGLRVPPTDHLRKPDDRATVAS